VVLSTQVVQTVPAQELAALRQEIQNSSQASQAGLENLQGQIAEIHTAQTDLLANLQPTPTTAQEITLSIPGVQLLEQEEGWIILFDEGLFPYGWALSQPARQMLDELILQLKPYAGNIEVSIVGFKSSDEQDEYFDLGLMRSVVVLDYLESSGQLPADLFRIQPQASLTPPFSNDTVTNRGRNRTVILILRLKVP
jgi:flagellar motor protein MotB